MARCLRLFLAAITVRLCNADSSCTKITLFEGKLAATAEVAGDPEAPSIFTIIFETDVPGNIELNCSRALAPLGADRLFAATRAGFYNDSALFRVVPGFVLQFGISGNAALNEEWLNNAFPDDPVLASNTVGTLTFATAGPNTRTTQLFINYVDNSFLDSQGFAPFCDVVSGMDVAEAVFNPTPDSCNGVDQGQYEAYGNAWIAETYPGINFITGAIAF